MGDTPGPADTLFGANFLTGAEEGLLDGAIIRRYRIVWHFQSGDVQTDIQGNPSPFGHYSPATLRYRQRRH